MADIRPIGTRFDYCFPPSNISWMNGLRVGSLSTDGDAFKVFTYEVESHVQTDQGLAEQWKPISGPIIYPVKEWQVFRGWISPVPPIEVVPLLGDDWKEPKTVMICS